MDLSKYIRFLIHYRGGRFHPNVNLKNGSGNESQRAKTEQNGEKSRSIESDEQSEKRVKEELSD